MVGLLLLRQMFNVSDEVVVGQWVQNPYWQHFCGMGEFQWELPCDPSDLVYYTHPPSPEDGRLYRLRAANGSRDLQRGMGVG